MEEMKTTTFAQRLKEVRIENGLTQVELSELADVGKSMIAKWECAVCEPRPTTIDKLASVLGVKRQWLAYGTGDKTQAETENRKQEKIRSETRIYRVQDERDLRNIELCIMHLRDMSVSLDEKMAIHATLSKVRASLEMKVVFGTDD